MFGTNIQLFFLERRVTQNGLPKQIRTKLSFFVPFCDTTSDAESRIELELRGAIHPRASSGAVYQAHPSPSSSRSSIRVFPVLPSPSRDVWLALVRFHEICFD
jgi:hypothetical protein